MIDLMQLLNVDIRNIKKAWNETLIRCNSRDCKLKRGEGFITYPLLKIKRIDNGYSCKSAIPRGLSLKGLVDSKEILESNLNARITIDKSWDCKFINIKIITKRPKIVIEKVKCSCNELLCGYTLEGKPNLVNLNVDPHILFTGTTGTGKTIALFIALTNLLANSDKNYELYFAQIVNRETSLFSKCKNVKQYAKTLEDAELMLTKILKEIERRNDLLERSSCRDINQFNKHFPDKKVKRIILITEEFSFFKVNDDVDDKETKELKKNCEAILLQIVKAGRSNNVNLISVLQRPTVHSLDTTIRSQLSVLTFKQKSENDSKIAIQQGGAELLRQREAYFDGRQGLIELLYPIIDDELYCLKDLVPEIRLPEINIFEEKKEVDLFAETQELKKRAKTEHMEVCEEYRQLLEDRKAEEPIKTNGTYDNLIMKHLEVFGAISAKQLEMVSDYNNNNARRRLKELEKKGVLISYKYMDSCKEKLYCTKDCKKRLNEHENIINNFYTQLFRDSDEILEVNRYPRLLNGTIRPDLYVKYRKGQEVKELYLEVDLTHFTNNDKMLKYDYWYSKGNDFDLYILKAEKPDFRYNGKIKIIHQQLYNFSIF